MGTRRTVAAVTLIACDLGRLLLKPDLPGPLKTRDRSFTKYNRQFGLRQSNRISGIGHHRKRADTTNVVCITNKYFELTIDLTGAVNKSPVT